MEPIESLSNMVTTLHYLSYCICDYDRLSNSACVIKHCPSMPTAGKIINLKIAIIAVSFLMVQKSNSSAADIDASKIVASLEM